jgi:DNA (cytosine-5)-methyltransferase 1
MNVLDLFSGIGGFSLGLERAGMKTVAFCEIDEACHKVLRKHWPETPIFSDVTKLSSKDLNEHIDVICGGFPCQDISTAGKGVGLAGERSGLWFQFHRLISEIRPSYAIIENVSALRSRGLDQVLRSLAEIGYDAEWHCIPASAVGAPHRRDRVWIVAYPHVSGRDAQPLPCTQRHLKADDTHADQSGQGCGTRCSSSPLAYPNASRHVPHKYGANTEWSPLIQERQIQSLFESRGQGWWASEPGLGRVAHGIPGRSHRLKQLGNAVVPQIPELIGRAIQASIRCHEADLEEFQKAACRQTPSSTPPHPTPPQRKPLTDAEIDNCWYQSGGVTPVFARAIERAHGIGGKE